MYLVHKPSGLGVFIGKRMGYGWYDAPDGDKIQKFYDRVEYEGEGSRDDFVLLMEDCESSICGSANKPCEKDGDFLRFKPGDGGL
jgi:hypothetical protein